MALRAQPAAAAGHCPRSRILVCAPFILDRNGGAGDSGVEGFISIDVDGTSMDDIVEVVEGDETKDGVNLPRLVFPGGCIVDFVLLQPWAACHTWYQGSWCSCLTIFCRCWRMREGIVSKLLVEEELEMCSSVCVKEKKIDVVAP